MYVLYVEVSECEDESSTGVSFESIAEVALIGDEQAAEGVGIGGDPSSPAAEVESGGVVELDLHQEVVGQSGEGVFQTEGSGQGCGDVFVGQV